MGYFSGPVSTCPVPSLGLSPRPRAVKGCAAPGRICRASVIRAAGAMAALPKLVAFDLDDTIWTPELYEMDGPFQLGRDGVKVVDSRQREIRVYAGAELALLELTTQPQWQGVQVAYASRTDHDEWAAQCLALLRLPGGATVGSAAGLVEIQRGTKKKHFAALAKRSGVAYADMLFFDNEHWNITEVQQLGVACVYTPGGMTEKYWRQGLALFAARRGGEESNKTTGRGGAAAPL